MDDLGTRSGASGPAEQDPRAAIDAMLADYLATASVAQLRRWAADLREQADELDRIAAERAG